MDNVPINKGNGEPSKFKGVNMIPVEKKERPWLWFQGDNKHNDWYFSCNIVTGSLALGKDQRDNIAPSLPEFSKHC